MRPRRVFPLGFFLAALVSPVAAQQPTTDPVVVATEAAAEALERVGALEAEVRSLRDQLEKGLAGVKGQATVDRSRFAAALYRLANAEDPDSRGREFGRNPQKQEGSLFAAADGLASRIRARDEAAQLAPAASSAAAPAEPATAQPAPTAPATAPVAPAPAISAPPAPPAPRAAPAPATDRDRKIADEIERLISGLAGLARALRQ